VGRKLVIEQKQTTQSLENGTGFVLTLVLVLFVFFDKGFCKILCLNFNFAEHHFLVERRSL